MGIYSLCLLFFLIVNVSVQGASHETIDCIEPLGCGNDGITIKFPFRLRDRKTSTNCGYPGFDLSCTDKNRIVLELPLIPIKLYVADIDYYSQTIYVYNPDFYDGFQKKPSYSLESFNLSTSPFQFAYDFSRFTLLNCSGHPSGIYRRHRISCYNPGGSIYEDGGDKICTVYSNNQIEDYDELVNCTKIYDFNAPLDPDEMYNPPLMISLKWSTPSCMRCEEIYKGCRLKNKGTQNETECFDLFNERKGKDSAL